MKGTIHDVDAQRARWLRLRTGQRLTMEAGKDFALGGLGRYVDSLDVRLVFLPDDPDADRVPLNGETLAWLKKPRPTPYGGPAPQWGHRDRATSCALVVYDQYRDDAGWGQYPGPRQSRGLHRMSEHAYRWHLAPGLDQRGRVAPGHDVRPSDK